jgi:hypothetical protein
LTAFYKHPVEILTDGALAAVVMYPLLGSSLEGALRFNFFAAAGELFYHANIRTPHWVKYFIQTPELHSIIISSMSITCRPAAMGPAVRTLSLCRHVRRALRLSE